MYTTMIARQISEILVPLGMVGVVLAVLSVVATCVMVIVRGEDIGIPVAGWIVGTLMSLAAGFSDLRPLIICIGAGLVMALFVLIVLRIKRADSGRGARRYP